MSVGGSSLGHVLKIQNDLWEPHLSYAAEFPHRYTVLIYINLHADSYNHTKYLATLALQ